MLRLGSRRNMEMGIIIGEYNALERSSSVKGVNYNSMELS
jgi:hypothetical protein